MSDNLKLFKNDKDIIIECLTERIKDLEFTNSNNKETIKSLQSKLNFFDKYSKRMTEFKHFLKWKDKINNIISSYQNIDFEVLNDEFADACQNKDIDKMCYVWEKYMKVNVLDLLSIIEDKDLEIERLTNENEELREELEG